MTLTQVATLPKPDKQFKDYCNSLRCPLCNGQLDGNINPKEARLYCVNNSEEYKVIVRPNLHSFYIEIITYWYSQFQYEINIYYIKEGMFQTSIARFNMDASPRQRYKTMVTVFNHVGSKINFFRQRMEEDVFLKKLKLYNVFS
jgi:hypothetical protein